RPLVTEQPKLVDIPFTIMRLFGQAPPRYMQGGMILAEGAQEAPVKGFFDPRRLEQSGCAPGALAVLDEVSHGVA
ncbi:MAG: hypothetical protein FJ102_27260, partial [Deltaproteobacteria bacterium]|nr:hypothetical protein [Deltaproteobacteria bacterium]